MVMEKLAELNPLKLLAGIVFLGALMVVGLLMASTTGPTAVELHEAQLRKTQMEFMMQQQEMIDEATRESQLNISAEDIGRAMTSGE